MEIITVLFLLFSKHFVCDFMYQPPYMYLNKGTFGHPGGLLHSGLHGIVSFALLALVVSVNMLLFWVVLAESIAHYLIDWAKMNLNKSYGFTPTNGEEFWQLLGLDQYCHHVTYIFMTIALLHI